MCGIAGFVDLWDRAGRPAEDREEILARMCRIIRHRGPDDQGLMVKPGVALGMRRLAIIDLVSGNQPMSGEDGSVTIVFNGEIYNFQELKPKLEARGHKFHTHSDTEAIVHAYEEFGPECLKDLRGMFAFAIWDDKSAHTLHRARPRRQKAALLHHHAKRHIRFWLGTQELFSNIRTSSARSIRRHWMHTSRWATFPIR